MSGMRTAILLFELIDDILAKLPDPRAAHRRRSDKPAAYSETTLGGSIESMSKHLGVVTLA